MQFPTAPRILIADDMPELRRLLVRVIQRDGRFEIVGEAEDGQQAVEMAEQLRPDLVILDMMMPKKSGLVVLGEVRAICPDTRVLFFTGVDPGVAGAEADATLGKGATPAEIVAAIERALTAAPRG